MLRLEVLLETKNAEFKPALANCQRDAATNQSKIYELATWEMAKTSPADALAWLRSLPMNMQTNQPATTACRRVLHGGEGLEAASMPGWKSSTGPRLEFLRHAFMSRALRGQELADTAKTEWEQALKSANSQKQSMVMLLRLAAQWNWVNEGEDLLWTIVNRYPQDKWAVAGADADLVCGRPNTVAHAAFQSGVEDGPLRISRPRTIWP